MEYKMSLSQDLLDTIVNFIAKRKKNALEKAFKKNDKFLSAIRRLDTSYTEMQKIIDDFCIKNPEACKSAELKRKARGL